MHKALKKGCQIDGCKLLGIYTAIVIVCLLECNQLAESASRHPFVLSKVSFNSRKSGESIVASASSINPRGFDFRKIHAAKPRKTYKPIIPLAWVDLPHFDTPIFGSSSKHYQRQRKHPPKSSKHKDSDKYSNFGNINQLVRNPSSSAVAGSSKPKDANPRKFPLRPSTRKGSSSFQSSSQLKLGKPTSSNINHSPEYSYEYKVNEGDVKIRHEESRQEDVVHGEYSFLEADGYTRIVRYTADQDGFKAKVTRIPPKTMYFG